LPSNSLVFNLLDMTSIPGTLRERGAAFVTAQRSVVDDSSSESKVANAALNQLCYDYWPSLYSFVRRRGYSPADAQDLTAKWRSFDAMPSCFIFWKEVKIRPFPNETKQQT
jgi:hypothetical protein